MRGEKCILQVEKKDIYTHTPLSFYYILYIFIYIGKVTIGPFKIYFFLENLIFYFKKHYNFKKVPFQGSDLSH